MGVYCLLPGVGYNSSVVLRLFCVEGGKCVSAILLLLRSRLLRPVFIALGVALVIEVGLALALTRAAIVQLVETLDTHLGEDVRVIAAELERAGQEVRAGLASLSQRTEERLAAGLSVRLEEEQVRLREVLVAGLRRSADDQASLLAAVAPKAIVSVTLDSVYPPDELLTSFKLQQDQWLRKLDQLCRQQPGCSQRFGEMPALFTHAT